MSASERTPADQVPPSAPSPEAMVADIRRVLVEGGAGNPALPPSGLRAEGQAVRVPASGRRRRPMRLGRTVSLAGAAVLALGGIAWLALGGVHSPVPPGTAPAGARAPTVVATRIMGLDGAAP
jgi:hypothetical protein